MAISFSYKTKENKKKKDKKKYRDFKWTCKELINIVYICLEPKLLHDSIECKKIFNHEEHEEHEEKTKRKNFNPDVLRTYGAPTLRLSQDFYL